MRFFVLTWIAVATAVNLAAAATVQSDLWYHSSISSDAGGSLDLRAELNYESVRTHAPVAVVMHGYSPVTGNLSNVRANAQRLRDAGFFVISVAMRGRDGSDGARDSGGLEIYDIYDAVEAAKTKYTNYVDADNISITGYSGGGGNVMSALTKFPDYFRAGSAFFGMSDYGYDTTNGWYYQHPDSRAQLKVDIGDPTTGNPAVRDRYMARASNLAARNNPYSEIHLFVNRDESTCPPVHDLSYRDMAVAAQSSPGEFDKITVHVGASVPPYEYEDFNHNGKNEPGELQFWPHGFPAADRQHAAEQWYLTRLLDASIPQPVLNAAGSLFVTGYVKTAPFEFWLGDGQNAAGDLDYSLSAASKTFHLTVLSSYADVSTMLKVDTQDMAGRDVEVLLNGNRVDQFVGGGQYQYDGLRNNGTLSLLAVPEPGVSTQWGMGGLVGLLACVFRNRSLSR